MTRTFPGIRAIRAGYSLDSLTVQRTLIRKFLQSILRVKRELALSACLHFERFRPTLLWISRIWQSGEQAHASENLSPNNQNAAFLHDQESDVPHTPALLSPSAHLPKFELHTHLGRRRALPEHRLVHAPGLPGPSVVWNGRRSQQI
jgi:hypothetical protein